MNENEKKVKKKIKIAKLEQEVEALRKENVTVRKENKALRSELIPIWLQAVALAVAVIVGAILGSLTAEDAFLSYLHYPRGKEITDNFIPTYSKMEVRTIFNLKGYLKANGFKHYEVSYADDYPYTYIYAKARNRYWGVKITTEIDRSNWVYYHVDGATYNTKVEFYRIKSGGTRDYTVTYLTKREFDPANDPIVADIGSSMMLPLDSLEEIDAVLKHTDYSGKERTIASRYYLEECPFEGLGIEHYTDIGFATSSGISLHDD